MKTEYVREGFVTLDPFLVQYFGVSKACQKGSTKPQKKTFDKNLRSRTLAPDSVENVRRVRKASNGYRTYHTPQIHEIQAQYE